ncbi:MAG TPA: hypothetical protein DIT01_05230 [Lentisphaeria bacterium]|nr:hypothetical protein [Lentisphaeria bacterium]
MKRLDGQIAWIGGGASGMGEAAAELCAEEGAKVVVADIQVERGQEVVERIAGPCSTFARDANQSASRSASAFSSSRSPTRSARALASLAAWASAWAFSIWLRMVLL